ncbi:MAG: Nif3-like dinuclear metal center hexameric protein [Actinomycetota bacterium]|nr:Nif3-like dinuclear metal center hexameric protein [Actinomycetota bacterium]
MTARPSIGDLLTALGRMAPWSKAAGWDPVGLQLGDPAAPVARVAVCHEVTELVVEAVESQPPDLLISYHPLLFRPTTRLVAGSSPSGRALRLLRAGVSLAVTHTNFDVVRGGAADALADTVLLGDVVGFAPVTGPDSVKVVTFVPAEALDRVAELMGAAGAGAIGNYTHCSFRTEGTGTFFAAEGAQPAVGELEALNREPEVRLEMVAPRGREAAVVEALVAAHPYEEPAYDVYERRGDSGMLGRIGRPPSGTTLGTMAKVVGERLGDRGLRVSGELSRELVWVAVLPGAGSEFVEEAAGLGADLLVTGDVSHHRAREALDRGLAVIDPGHAATERPGVQRLYAAVAEAVQEAVDLTQLDPSPWR